MTKKQAEAIYKNELKENNGVLTFEEVVARLGKTTIRCGWVDFVDYLVKDKQVNEKQASRWGQLTL